MTLKKHLLCTAFFILSSQFIFSQEGIPIYSDYLTDNYYLLHPSMAGVANCNKIRITSIFIVLFYCFLDIICNIV